jgi:hypothetical protein
MTSKTSPSTDATARNALRPALQTPLEPTSSAVDGFTAAAQSAATRRAYAGDLKHFRQHGGKIPATPQMVANYVAAFAGTHAVATIQRRLIALHQAHTEQGLTSPVMDRLVKRTMQGIRRTCRVAPERQVKALVKSDILEMLVMVNRQKPMNAARDRALLLIGFAGRCAAPSWQPSSASTSRASSTAWKSTCLDPRRIRRASAARCGFLMRRTLSAVR